MRPFVLGPALALAACAQQSPEQAFQARAYGAAYAQFPGSGVELVVSRTSGRPAACGYATTAQSKAHAGAPFIWVDGELYAGERLFRLKESETFRLCGPNWVGPKRIPPPVSRATEAGTPAAPDRSPAGGSG
jgi:hypothetical protein